MSVCTIFCGANDWNSNRLFAEHKDDWFCKHLTVEYLLTLHSTDQCSERVMQLRA